MKCSKCQNEVAHPRMSSHNHHGYGWECRCGWFNRKPKQQKPKATAKPKVIVVDKNNYNQCQKCGKTVSHPAQSKGIHGYGWECRCGWFNRKPKQQRDNNRGNNRGGKRSKRDCPMCDTPNPILIQNGYWDEWYHANRWHMAQDWREAKVKCSNRKCNYRWEINRDGSPA